MSESSPPTNTFQPEGGYGRGRELHSKTGYSHDAPPPASSAEEETQMFFSSVLLLLDGSVILPPFNGRYRRCTFTGLAT